MNVQLVLGVDLVGYVSTAWDRTDVRVSEDTLELLFVKVIHLSENITGYNIFFMKNGKINR